MTDWECVNGVCGTPPLEEYPIPEALLISQLIFGILVFIITVILLILIYKLFVKFKPIVNSLEGMAKTISQFDDIIEVVVDNQSQDVIDRESPKDRNRSYSSSTHKNQSNVRRINESFGTKTSDGLESIPESSHEQKPIRMQEIFKKMGSVSSSGSGKRSVIISDKSGDSSLFSDTITKMDRIIDKTFDDIIKQVIDNPKTYQFSSDDD